MLEVSENTRHGERDVNLLVAGGDTSHGKDG
jgi:hypothetical protein